MKKKPITWIRTSFEDLFNFPVQVKKEAGYQLHRIQNGFEPENYKPFKQAGPGVKEIRISEANGIFRIMYVAKFAEAVYVLHAFEKKRKRPAKRMLILQQAVIAERENRGLRK